MHMHFDETPTSEVHGDTVDQFPGTVIHFASSSDQSQSCLAPETKLIAVMHSCACKYELICGIYAIDCAAEGQVP